MTIIASISAGLLVGLVVGALGAGGGILSVPALVYLLGQSPHEAATSSLIIVSATALMSLWSRIRKGQVRWGAGIIFALGSTVGAFLGTWLNGFVDGQLLMGLFAGLLAAVGATILRSGLKKRRQEQGEGAAASPKKPPANTFATWARVLAAATVTGTLTGFFGVGGGFVVVPALILVLGLSIRDAAGTSLVIMILTAAASLVARIPEGINVDWPVIAPFMVFSILGGTLGSPLSQRVRSSTLNILFAALVLAIAVVTAVQLLAS